MIEWNCYHNDLLSEEFISKYKNQQPQWGFNGLGYIVYKRTYSRTKEDGTSEEWWETILRCINGAQKIGAKYNQDEAERLYNYVFNLKCNFAGRSLWQLGTNGIERFGNNSLINCFYVDITELEDFCFVFENLMLGAGVGFSVRREHIYQLPKVKKLHTEIKHESTKDADFIVPDSREGWVELLRKVLTAYFTTGKGFSYSTILVRGYGEKISGFGGTASGPQILIDGIQNICHVLSGRINKKARSVDVLDIVNIIGSIVVAGNVRRSSEIALGDPDDVLFLKAKRWDLGNIPNWRAMSNNTIVADSFDHVMDRFWDGYQGNGEPYGLFNLRTSQKYGRIGEKIDDDCSGTNPCGEISLASHEACNLAELYLNNIESKDELIDCARLLYKTQKAVAAGKYIHEKTNKIIHKNMRLGLGITGICQSYGKLEWLDDCYKELRKFDKIWSKLNDINESIKLTTTKPSGTLSLLAGATPGVHPGYAKYYIRRVRMSAIDPMVEYCKSLGFKTEFVENFDGSFDRNTIIVEFPCNLETGVVAKDMSAVEQLDLVKKIQTVWADNSVSCTVYYRKHELDDIKKWLETNYEKNIKSISFLLHQDHGFKQAPYQEITHKEFEELRQDIKPIGFTNHTGLEELEQHECANGVCPIK